MPSSPSHARPSTPCGQRGDRAASALQVAPSAVEFAAVERGPCYVAALSVRNASDRVLRFRLTPPRANSLFRVLLRGRDLARSENGTVTLPPGLSTTYDVAFQQPDVDLEAEADAEPMAAIVHDALLLRGDDGSALEVPLLARRACPLLEVTPALCELGLVVLSQRAARFVQVRNSGARPGRFVVEVLDANAAGSTAAISVTPTRGLLRSQQVVNVKVEALGLELGVFRGLVRVRIRESTALDEEDEEEEDEPERDQTTAKPSPPAAGEKVLDVSGRVVEHTAELVLRRGLEPVTSLFFGSLFAGESRSVETLLRNNGPQPLQFKTAISFGGGSASSPGLEEDRETYERRKELRVTPADGCIEPFSDAVVTFVYHPRALSLEAIERLDRRQRSSESAAETSNSGTSAFALLPAPPQPLSAFASIICEQLQSQNLTLEVSAKTYVPRLQLTPFPPLDFGDVRSHDRVDLLLSLKNLSGLPVRFEAADAVAHFAVRPRSGRLDVLQSQSLVVSFTPSQLGTFRSVLTLRINGDVLELPVPVVGCAASVGSVPPSSERLVGGPEALPADFAPQFKFLLPDEARRSKGRLAKRFQRQPPHELAALNGTAALDEFEFQGTNNTHLTYCVKELARRADHRAAYHAYLAECRVQRVQREAKTTGKAQGLKKSVAQARGRTTNQEDDVDLDMERAQPRGLRLPTAALASDPLWLNQQQLATASGGGKLFFDEHKLVKKKFKATPATPAELMDCAQPLEFDELEQIVSGPKTLNFGRLSVNGSATRSLTVQNNLPRNVLVALHLGGDGPAASGARAMEELARKTPLLSQVVPPRARAGFDLVFCSSREQFFQQPLSYSLNGAHYRQTTVVAEVAPITVEIAPSELRLELGALDLRAAVTREVTLTNTSESEAPFVWSRSPLVATPDSVARPDSSQSNATTTVTAAAAEKTGGGGGGGPSHALPPVFEVLPASGTLRPSATMLCTVVYTPPSTGSTTAATWLSQTFQLDVTGGDKATLSCRALLPEVKVAARDKRVDFGAVSVGVAREKRVTLANVGKTPAVCYASIDPPAMALAVGLHVTPTQLAISAQDAAELTVTLLPHRAVVLEGQQVVVVVAIRGGKVLRLPVNASVVVPDVTLVPLDAVDFGEVVLGVAVPRLLSLENRSAISASLILDLRSPASALTDEFALATPARLLAHLDDASSVFVPLSSTEGGEQDEVRCAKWQISIPPHTTVSCHLVFTPRRVGSHDAVLPLQIAGVGSGPASPLFRRIVARAIEPRLRFSSATLHFQRCVITREGIRKVPYTKSLVLSNADTRPLHWQIDTARLRQGHLVLGAAKRGTSACPTNSATAVVFHLAPDRGELAPGEEVTLRVSFLPLDAVEYAEDELPLLVDDEPYVHLSLRGEGIYPHLSFSASRVVLPTVPLGVTARARFLVHATGYDHLELACRVPLDTARAPLTVSFPQGKTLSMACPSLPVELRFASSASVAFNARLEFFDADGNAFALPVAGCAENCLLSNYSFLQTHGLASERLDEADTSAASPPRHRKELLQREAEGAARGSFGFYTHPSGRYPIYLLSSLQIEAELTKSKQQRPQSSQIQQQAAASGFVTVDPSTGLEDEDDAAAATASEAVPFSEGEVQLMLQYLNANFLRTPVTRFPQDFSDTGGRPLYELLDMVCTKKPGGLAVPSLRGPNNARKPGAATASTVGTGAGAAGPSVAPPPASKKDQLTQYTTQYTELLRFLRSYGAMVHDVYPEQLLAQEFYLRACESPQADQALFASPAVAALPFVARRRALESEWPGVSATAWMKVLYQVLKCFLLARITWKSYQQQSGESVSPTVNTSSSGKRKPDKLAPPATRACQGSNVYSEAEMVLLQWLCDSARSVRKLPSTAAPESATALDLQLLDLGRDLRDGRWLFHLVAAHIPTLSVDQSAYQCFRWTPEVTGTSSRPRRPLSAAQLQHQAHVLLQLLGAFGVDFGLDATRFLRHFSGREMLVLLLHLQQTLPQFIPKATIEFRGGLGQLMEKSIELKNPSARPLRYHVFLDGAEGSTAVGDAASAASEFTIEANELVLEPGKTVAFVVTFRPRFSRKVTARLVFQAVRGDAGGGLASSGAGATMVFLLESNIVSRKPVRVIQMEVNTYDKRVEELVIENQFPANATYKLSMTQQSAASGGAEGSTGLLPRTSATPSATPAVSRGSRRRSVQSEKPPVASQASSSGFGMGPDSSSTAGRKLSMVGRHRGDDTDVAWCLCAQQPFFLPDFGTSGSSSEDSTGAESGNSGGLAVPPPGVGAAVAIRKNGSAKVKLEFLPLLPGHYSCQLLFLDENVGEFLLEIHAVAHLPASLETLEIQCEASSGGAAAPRFHFPRELTIPAKNPSLSRALAVFVDRASGHLRAKLKDGLKRCEDSHHTSFHVDFNSPFFSASPPELTLTPAGAGGAARPSALVSGRLDAPGTDGAGAVKAPLKANQARLGVPRSTVAGVNSVLLDFQPKGAGRYACKLLLRSRHTVCGSSDVRVYDIVAKVKEPNMKTQLEFVAPARHSIVQEIPLSNPTDASWTLKAVFSSANGSGTRSVSMFSGPATLLVPAKRSATYPLTFTPSWISHETSTFALVNTATQQQFDFELSGYGEEPLAQDHVILACQARSSVVHNFDVFALSSGGHGATEPQVLKVESDLRDVVGASSVVVPAGSSATAGVKYPLTFSPLVSGSYFGSVTFTNEATREYLWYTVEAAVSPPEPETTLEMRAAVRGAVGVEIRLNNPLDSATTFTVELRGRGLLGPSTFTLEARQSGVYELVYSPLLVTRDTGQGEEGAILFASDAVGQFWYRLQLVANAAEPQTLDDMTCAVGDVCTQPLWLQNPSDRELTLQYRVTNTRNFSIKGSTSSKETAKASTRVMMPPFGRASVVVEYTPSSLSDFESTSIIFFESGVASDWEFTVRGHGRAPSVMKPLVVTARVQEAASTLFTFRNPFAAPLRVDVKLIAEENGSSPAPSASPLPSAASTPSPVFDMLLKKRRVLLESFGLLQVPISFLPRAVSETRAELVICGSDEYAELEWRYPLRGVAEAPLHPRALATLACQARDSVEKRVECELLAAPTDMVLEDESFSVEWDIDAERFGAMTTAAAIERALTVTPQPSLGSSPSRSTIALSYLLRFDPLRPYRGSVALLIRKKSGGLWRFEVALDAGDPPVDDVLSIESSLNQTSSVTFQLRNQFREPAAFQAEFSAGSSSAFTVYPVQGVLPPYGSADGAAFVVSFTPTGYGKMQSGQLAIVTEEMQWTFNVKGAYPDATPASRSSSGPGSSLSLGSSAGRRGGARPARS